MTALLTYLEKNVMNVPTRSNGNNNQTVVGYMSDLCLQQLFVHSEPAICLSTTR
jgi:hypothetical protein